jgi:thioredoxin reductase (NADPH)
VSSGGRSYDLVIIGAGLAGLTAALFAARRGLSTLVLEATAPGGHLINVEKIEDFPGFPEGAAGYDLCPMVQEQAANNGAEFELAEARAIEPAAGDWRVQTTAGDFRSRALIVATGARPRTLGVPGEASLVGRGISHCATCDGPLFRGKVVGVAGGGDSALQEALTLASFASRVVLFERSGQLTGQQVFCQRLAQQRNVEVRLRAAIEEVVGNNALTGVRAIDLATGREETVALDGLFVYVGLRPNTELLGPILELDAGGHVPTDGWLRTLRPGLFAVGDVRRGSAGQAITAAGDGARAAMAAQTYLQGAPWP